MSTASIFQKESAGSPRAAGIQRWGALLGGGALAVYGLTRRSPAGVAMAATGGILAYIGATTDNVPKQIVSHGSILVNCSREQAYQFWRDANELPRFVRHLDAEGRVAVFRELARVTRRHVLVDVLLGTGLVWAFKRTVKGRAWAEETGKRRPAHREVVAELEASGLRVVSRHALLPWVSQPHVYVCERK